MVVSSGKRFYTAVNIMVLIFLFPWIAGFLSALGEINGDFYLQTAFSNAVICLLLSLPLCIALLYLVYKSYTGEERDENGTAEPGVPAVKENERTA